MKQNAVLQKKHVFNFVGLDDLLKQFTPETQTKMFGNGTTTENRLFPEDVYAV